MNQMDFSFKIYCKMSSQFQRYSQYFIQVKVKDILHFLCAPHEQKYLFFLTQLVLFEKVDYFEFIKDKAQYFISSCFESCSPVYNHSYEQSFPRNIRLCMIVYNFYLMSQQRQNKKIDEVIQCLIQQQKLATLNPNAPQSISNLYESTKALLTEFQQHINRCKKYNQAKIYRKYQILINALTEQNSILKSKLAQELEARPSSQRYVSDLIDKMIQIRRQNEKLLRENQTLQNMLNSYQQKTQLLEKSKRENFYNSPQSKQLLKKQSEKLALKQSLNQFLTNKRTENQSLQLKEKSNFQKFLMLNKGKVQKWSLVDFLQKIDKWTSYLKDVRFLDRSKLKSNFQHSFQREPNDSLSPAIDKLPNTVNSLRIINQNRSYLQGSFSKRAKLVDRIISKNKKITSFRLKSLSQQKNSIEARTIE